MPPTSDIWEDESTMRFLTTGCHAPDGSPRDRKRITRKAAMFRMKGTTLLRVMADASTRIVPPPPPPAERQDIIAKTHADTGHFGQRRTQHLLLLSFWWPGLYTDVIKHCQNCAVCARVNTIFNAGDKQPNPIPANGLFYRWSCDLAGPFIATPRGNTYVMLCIEHFSKHLIVTAIPSKTAAQTAAVFRDQALSTFGACAEVAMDSGTELKGAFDNLIVEHRI